VRHAKYHRRDRGHERAARHERPHGHSIRQEAERHRTEQFGAERNRGKCARQSGPDLHAVARQMREVDTHQDSARSARHAQHAVADDDKR
jgi:hypothetical protein